MAILISLSDGWDFNLIWEPSKFLSAADSIPCEHTPCRFAVLSMIAVKFLALDACLPVSCRQSFVDLTFAAIISGRNEESSGYKSVFSWYLFKLQSE